MRARLLARRLECDVVRRRRLQKMWKTIVLCASLFAGAALGLGAAIRFMEPAALPAIAAIGLCLIGFVLILAAPAPGTDPADDAKTLRQTRPPMVASSSSGSHAAVEESL
jgi:hypothetical protein